MNAFDFHFHPLFKRYLTTFDDTARQTPDSTLPVRQPGAGHVVDALAGHIFENQASVAQVLANKLPADLRLGVAAVLAMEYVFASRKGLLQLLELELLGHDVVARLDSRFIDFVNLSQGSYAELLEKELNFYQWVSQAPAGGLRYQLNLLSRKKGPIEEQLDAAKLNVALAIEGGHSLSRRVIRQLVGPYDPVAQVNHYRAAPEVDFLYLTLTHLSHVLEQQLCSHAFGFKLVKNLPDARPQFGGLTPLGRDVVRACVDRKTNDYPILIDIKHMSARGRDDFFSCRRELLAQKPDGFVPPGPGDTWPILATHMGVTGYRRRELGEHLAQYGQEAANPFSVRLRLLRTKAGHFKEGLFSENVFFNASSIGLFDEDIEEIARSGGLIGISLDSRILGFQSVLKRNPLGQDYDDDYFSREDFAFYFPHLSQRLPPVPEEDDEPVRPGSELLFPTVSLGNEALLASQRTRELYLFCLNVLHIVATIQQLNLPGARPAWEFVCIGSDYDGLIASIKSARTVEMLPAFRQELLAFFPKAEKAYRKLRGTVGQLLPRPSENELDVAAALEALFYGNGRRFLTEWGSK